MIPVLTAEDVRRQDAEAESRGISVETLMENAGWAVARAARRMMGGCYGRRVVVVCGKGNNAGDGLVAGRVLIEQGAHVTAALITSELNELASRQRARFLGRIVTLDALQRELSRADLVIDAIFGVGLKRAPEGDFARAIDLLGRSGERGRAAAVGVPGAVHLPVLSVDIPSGIDSDTGARLMHAGPGIDPFHAVQATNTITFSGYKPGVLFAPGALHCGDLEVADIGAPQTVWHRLALNKATVSRGIPLRSNDTNKRRSGTVLVVAGSRSMPGAAALAAAAAVHAGAGLTTLCAPEDVCRVVLTRVPEITTIPVPESNEGSIDIKALDLLRPRLPEFRAIALGPGLTTHPATVELVRGLISETKQPIVIDADALNALHDATEILRGRKAIITPHSGELSRLVRIDARELDADRLNAAEDAARSLDCVVLLKGLGTVITDGARTYVNTTGSGALAQGGTGDALTGIIASFIAQILREPNSGYDVSLLAHMAAVGAWIHGYAADRISARISPHPANASALIDELGPAMHEVCA